MRFKIDILKRFFYVLIAVLSVAAFYGCSSGGPDKAVETQRLDTALTYRSYFNKVQGNYDALSAADKAAFIKLAGSGPAAEKAWDQMKFGPGGAPKGAAGSAVNSASGR